MDDFQQLLQEAAKQDASDLFINDGAKPTIKSGSGYQPISDIVLTPSVIEAMVQSLLTASEWETLTSERSLDIGRDLEGVGRFRINIYFQKRSLAVVTRYIKSKIPSLENLGLPENIKSLALAERGIILVTGGTGVGKSTTLASIVDFRNRERQGHIITIEDPIEYIHQHQQSLISQREVGIDTHSFSDALKYALREAPDTVVIGEIRESAVAEQALRLAETGHLCLASLHATSTNLAIERFINLFTHSPKNLEKELASHLVAVIGQRMGIGTQQQRVMIPEILLNTSQISDCIEQGEFAAIKQAMTDNAEGCITFDESLFDKVREGTLSCEEALRLSDSKINLSLKLQTEGFGSSSNPQRDLTNNPERNLNKSQDRQAKDFNFNATNLAEVAPKNNYDSQYDLEPEFSWKPPEDKNASPSFLHIEKSWLSDKANFLPLKSWAIKAHPRCAQINRNLEALISQAISFTLKEKGYSTQSPVSDAVIHFVFTPEQACENASNHTKSKHMLVSNATKTQLVLQAKDTIKGQIFWRTSVHFIADTNCLTFQEFQTAFEELLKNWPDAQQNQKAC